LIQTDNKKYNVHSTSRVTKQQKNGGENWFPLVILERKRNPLVYYFSLQISNFIF